MANTYINTDKYIWQIFAPQVNHIFGYFETLKEARKVARLLYEPEKREDLSFFKYREKDGTEVYEILRNLFRNVTWILLRLRSGRSGWEKSSHIRLQTIPAPRPSRSLDAA